MVTFLRLEDLIIFYLMSCSPYMPNAESLCDPHDLEEAGVPTNLTPVNVDGSKKILREDVLLHALDHPTKFQPDPSSHLGVYRSCQIKCYTFWGCPTYL